MTLPRPDEYMLAVQNPRNAFKDSELQSCKVETTRLGLPAVKSGGFALIYHLYRKDHWAIRCFYREIGNLQHRYDAISRFLEKNANGTFVKASLEPNGICVAGNYYPVIVMPWLVGDVLNLHIEKNLSKPTEISWLADAFLKLVNQLEQLGVAHGDLQHGNIMVRNNGLTLVDYDGMYLPELSKSPTIVLGHLNYIHPDRMNISPGPEMDRFPSIVIYLGLRAVAASPSLWRKYSGGENILFQRNDFLDPQSSPLIDDLKQIPSLRALAEKFQAICFLDYSKIPSLSEFLSTGYTPPPAPKPTAKVRPARTVTKPIEYITQYEVVLAEKLSGSSAYELFGKVGEKLEVVGQITDYREGKTQRDQDYMFLNFGDWRKHSFYIVLWEDALDLFRTSGVRPSSLVNEWVSVTGMITEYKGRPQIVVEMPSQIQKLSGRQEALRRVSTQKKAVTYALPQAALKSTKQTIVVVPAKQRRVNKPIRLYRSTPAPQPQDVLQRQQADALQRLYGRTSTPTTGPLASYLPSRPKRIRFPQLIAVLTTTARTIAFSRSNRKNANLFSLMILVIAFLSMFLMSYPSTAYTSTTVHTSASFVTQTSFVSATTTSRSYVFSTISSTACSYRQDIEVCKTLSSIGTSTSSGTYTSTQNQGAHTQRLLTSFTKTVSVSMAPYSSLGINSSEWSIAVAATIILAAVAAILVRRR